jgi:hypothetical protein
VTLAAAVARINTWLPTTFTRNFGSSMNALPTGADMPALALFPGEGFGSKAAAAVVGYTAFEVTFAIEHWIIAFGSGQKLASERLDALVTLVDYYMAKLITDSTLNSTLTRPIAVVDVALGVKLLGGLGYECAVLLQHWSVKY